MNSIVSQCKPNTNQNRLDDCGSYFVDLSENNQLSIGRSIQDFPVKTACTYRIMTTCGYPQASWRVNDERIAEDFDIAIAFMDNLQPTDELDIWEFDTEQTDSRTSYPSSKKDEYTHIRSPNSKALLGDDQWNTCKGIHRNMWVTITRIKNSTEQASGPERTARQLQTFPPFYPNGTKFADLDITFTNYRGSGSFLKVVYLAFAAGLAALAF